VTGSLFARLCGFAWWLRLAGFASCLGLLVLASFLAPEGAAEVATPYLRNLAHAPLFGLFALSFLVLSGPQAPLRPRSWALAMGLVLVAGFLDEWHQLYVPGRGSDAKDVVTDLLGGLISLLLAAWAARTPLCLRRGLLPLGGAVAALFLWGLVVTDGPLTPLPFVQP